MNLGKPDATLISVGHPSMSSDAAVTLFSVHELVTHILSYADLPTLSTLSAVSSRLCKLSRGVKLGDVDWRLLHRDEVLLDQWMSSAHRACKCEWPVHRKMQAGYPTGYAGKQVAQPSG